MKRCLKGGFTLVEVMVFSVVGLMFIGLLAQVFIAAMKRTEDSRLRVDVQQSAVIILSQFGRSLERVSTRSITASDGPLYVVATTQAQPGGWSASNDNRVQWYEEQTIWVYDKAKKTLHREEYPPESPSFSEPLTNFKPYRPTSVELQAVGSTYSGKERELSPYVEEFSLSDRTGNKTSFQSESLKLEMKLRRPLSSSDRFVDFTVSRWYTLRNAF